MFKFLGKPRDPIVLREWIVRYKKGKYKRTNFKTWVDAGWVDWFCYESELTPKIHEFATLFTGITNDVILDHYSVSFTNQCPATHPLYDVIRFTPFSTDSVTYFAIEIGDKRNDHRYEVYTERHGYGRELYADTAEELIEKLNYFDPHVNPACDTSDAQ